ncbi:MAG: hypothetical protein ACHP93_00625 [Solirubrobacterales bacterium]
MLPIWSGARLELTLIKHLYAVEQVEQADVELPNLCADLNAWVASDCKSIPVGTKQFQQRTEGGKPFESTGIIPIGLSGQIARLLAPYEDRAEKAISRRVKHLEAEVQKRGLRQLAIASAKIENTLSSPPAARTTSTGG